MRKIISIIVLSLLAVCAPQALAKPAHHKQAVKCKSGYLRKAKIVKKHGKPHVVHYCHKKATKTTPVGTAPTKSNGRVPHSHLDPSFEQSPLNPFSTNWFYSASATEEITDAQGKFVANQPAALPEGTLSFFVNGSLECAVNVGPGQESSNCDVMLKALGPQKVTTTYSSGSLSSTATEIDNVEPVPATTALSYSFEQWTQGESTAKGERVGTLHLHLAVSPPPAEPSFGIRSPSCRAEELPLCIPIPDMKFALPTPLFDAEGNAPVPVYMREEGSGPEVLIDAIPPGSSSGEVTWHPLSEIESGSQYLRYESQYVTGYSGSGTVEILGGRIQPIYIAKTMLAFRPELLL